MTQVTDEEIILTTPTLGPARFKLSGPVRVELLTPFAAKVTTGEYTRSNEQLASEQIMEDFRGGLLAEYQIGQENLDRMEFSTLDTEYEKQLTLLPLATSVGNASLSNRQVRCGEQFQGALYVAFDEVICRWQPSSESLVQVHTLNTGSGSETATDSVVTNLSGTDYLIFANGQGYTYYDGTTWTAVSGNGTTIPNAKYITIWDEKLYALDALNRLWEALTPGGAWTLKERIPIPTGELTGLFTFFNQSNDNVLFASTRSGIWLYDADAAKWRESRLRYPRALTGGQGKTDFRGNLYLSAGSTLYGFDGNNVRSVGLDRDAGLPSDMKGEIYYLADGFNWLVAAVNDIETNDDPPEINGAAQNWESVVFSSTTGQGRLFRWNENAWSTLWYSSTTGTEIYWCKFFTANNTPRLWFGVGTNLYFIPFPRSVFNPKNSPDYEFAASGILRTIRYDQEWAEKKKIYVQLEFRGQDLDANNTVKVEYATDNSDSYTTIATYTSNGPTQTDLGTSGYGFAARNIKVKVTLTRGSTTTTGPIVDYMSLKYYVNPKKLYSHYFQLDCSETNQHGNPLQQYELLKQFVEADTMVQIEYRRDGREIATKKVVLTAHGGETGLGFDERGQYQLAAAELK